MNVLFSVHPEYLDRILSREKTVELRNRPVRLQPNGWMWLYATTPRNRVEGRALICQIIIDTPLNIWRRFKSELAITKSEFVSYAGSRSLVSAIQLSKIERFTRPLRLSRIKAVVAGFHPPQFYVRLAADNRVYKLLEIHAKTNKPTDSREEKSRIAPVE